LTNDAAVREKNPQWFGGDPTIQEVVDRISEARGGNPISLNNSSPVAQAKGAFNPGAAIFASIESVPKDAPGYKTLVEKRIATIKSAGDHVLRKAGVKRGMTPIAAQQALRDAWKHLPEKLPDDEVPGMLEAALRRAGYTPKNLSTEKIARAATDARGIVKFNKLLAANPDYNTLNINQVVEDTGMSLKAAKGVVAPSQRAKVFDSVVNTFLRQQNKNEELRDDGLGGSIVAKDILQKLHTDGVLLPTMAGIETIKRIIADTQRKYPYWPKEQTDKLEDELKVKFAFKEARKRVDAANAVMDATNRAFDTAKSRETNKIVLMVNKAQGEATAAKVEGVYKGVTRKEIARLVERVTNEDGYFKKAKWMVHEALIAAKKSEEGKVDTNIVDPSTIELGYDGFFSGITDQEPADTDKELLRLSRAVKASYEGRAKGMGHNWVDATTGTKDWKSFDIKMDSILAQ
jgi:hypothetical protein